MKFSITRWRFAAIAVRQSHRGSGSQVRAVIDGLDADVVTVAPAYDVDALNVQGKLIPPNWQKRQPQNASPYTWTIVFLVRKGNPKGIKDWNDLIIAGKHYYRPGDPKTAAKYVTQFAPVKLFTIDEIFGGWT